MCSSMMLGEQRLDGQFVEDTFVNALKYRSSAQEEPPVWQMCMCGVPFDPKHLLALQC